MHLTPIRSFLTDFSPLCGDFFIKKLKKSQDTFLMISYRMTKLGELLIPFVILRLYLLTMIIGTQLPTAPKFFSEFLRYTDCLIMSWMTVQKTIHQRSP